VKKATEVVKPCETVEAVILGVNAGERRISLGLKQALGDPWAEVAQKFAVGSAVAGRVTSITKFGAFVQLAEGVEGMIHVSEISDEKRVNHPQEVLAVGQQVKAQVLSVDTEKRQLRLGMKQLVPTSLDEYIAEHKEGDIVTGRMIEVADGRVELGEGIVGRCRMDAANLAEDPGAGLAEAAAEKKERAKANSPSSKPDLSSLSSMLQARWKGGGSTAAGTAQPEAVRTGQIRKFRIAKLDAAAKKIELELFSS
jgi:small subunit ribosomal protein S1